MESDQRVMDEKGIGKWSSLGRKIFDKGINGLDIFIRGTIYCSDPLNQYTASLI